MNSKRIRDNLDIIRRNAPSIISDFLQYMFAAFIGPGVNILIGFGLLSYSSEKTLKFLDFFFSNEILYGVLSSVTGIVMSIIFFYMNCNKKRKSLNIILAFSAIVSIILSTIALIQTQIGNIFEPNMFRIFVYMVFASFIISAIFYNFDAETAEREVIVQKTADKFKDTESGKIGNNEFKL